MYTQALDLPDSALETTASIPLKSVPAPADPSTAKEAARFEAVMDEDGKIEPQDWMPEAYR